MALSGDLCGILAAGMERERASHVLYLEAAGRTRHSLGKMMFERLAADESKHEELLASWSAQGQCRVDFVFEPSVDADFIARAHAKLDKAIKGDAGDLEAIKIGQEMERNAIRFYADNAAKVADEPTKQLFLRLKSEEDKHLALLTDLYDYLSNPNVWMIREGHANFDS